MISISKETSESRSRKKMIKPANSNLKAFIGLCLILLQVSSSWCVDLSPSVVQIFSGQKYICSGTLVKDNFVVTSAECLAQPRDATVLTVVGNVPRDELTPADESSVIATFTPADFSEKSRQMDVAVLKLEKSITGSRIRPTELCKKTSLEGGEPLTLYFWDLRSTVPRIKSVDFKLRTLQLSVIANDICSQSYGAKYATTMFCAAEPNRNYFFYDRGGPAAVDGQFCGVFQYGDKDLKKTVPGSLTSLANTQVMQFITESLEK